jgi:hypothetical protein
MTYGLKMLGLIFAGLAVAIAFISSHGSAAAQPSRDHGTRAPQRGTVFPEPGSGGP